MCQDREAQSGVVVRCCALQVVMCKAFSIWVT